MKFQYLIFITFFSCNQEKKGNKIQKSETVVQTVFLSNTSKNISKQNDSIFYKGELFSGVLYELKFNSKDTISVEHFKDGILNGVSKKWYENNIVREYREFKNGQKDGKQIAYFENGKTKFEFIAKSDIYEGELKEYNNDGALIHLASYKNGQEEGTQKLWYDNGKIRANYVVLNGKRYGLLGTKNCKNVSDSIFNFK